MTGPRISQYAPQNSTELTTLNREIHLNENILRSLVLKIDGRIVETLVEHAKAGPIEMARARRPETPVPNVPAVVIEEPIEDLGNI